MTVPMAENPDRPHDVQLFDDVESLGAGVATFVREELALGNCMLVVTSQQHWNAIESSLREHGTDVEACRASGMLVVADSGETLSRVVRCGRLDEASFTATVGAALDELAGRGDGLSVYGDMVDLLAAEGNLRGAIQLERLWNSLLSERAITLLCGYTASSFGHPRDAVALSEICRLHNDVRSSPRDILGGFLVRSHTARRV